MASPTVSVVIPAFNAEEFISATISSVLNQTFSDLEVLVVDNLSTDDSVRITQQFDDPRVHLYQCHRRGATAARNMGIELSKGDYLQFLDADDCLAPQKIQKQLELLSGYPKRTVASCAWGRFVREIESAEFVQQRVWKDYEPAWKWLLDSWQGGGMMQTACWLVPRQIAENAGPWNETLISNPNDDGEYFCRVLLQSQGVAFCPINGVFYRSSIPGSLSRRVDDDAVESSFHTADLYEQHVTNAGLGNDFGAALRRNYLNLIYQFHPSRKDLVKKAWHNAIRLGGKNPKGVGGDFFQQVARLIGFMNALRLRQFMALFR